MKKKLLFILVILTVSMPVSLFAQNNEMIRINGGTFTMGASANEPGRFDGEGPQRQVT